MTRLALAVALALACGLWAAAAGAAPPRTTETASADGVRASVTYAERRPGVYDVRLSIVRADGSRFAATVAPYAASEPGNVPVGVYRKYAPGAHTITIRDLDGDGDPEVLLDFTTAGAHCCNWTRVYRFAGGAYRSSTHWWGDLDYRIESSGGVTVLASADDRFAYAFTSYAGSAFPVRIWAFRRDGSFADVTRTRLDLVRRDATRMWRGYVSQRRHGYEVRGVLAAWAADEALLGHGGRALAWLGAHRQVLGGAEDREQSGSVAAYLKRLPIFLRKTGYLS